MAKVYATTFPLPEGAQARRFNDREVEKAASELAKSAEQFKKDLESALKTDTTIDQPAKDAAVKEVDGLKEDAEKLASTLDDGRPASGEAKAVLDRAARIRGAAASSGRALSPVGADRMELGRNRLTKGGAGVRPAGAAPVSTFHPKLSLGISEELRLHRARMPSAEPCRRKLAGFRATSSGTRRAFDRHAVSQPAVTVVHREGDSLLRSRTGALRGVS